MSGLVASQLVAAYLLVASSFGVNVNELFAGQGIEDFKSFLRLRIDPEEFHGRQAEGALKSLLGKVAIANGKLTYQRYQQIFSGAQWEKLAAEGAQTQRVLWASTAPKIRTIATSSMSKN